MRVLGIDHGKRAGFAVLDDRVVVEIGSFTLNEIDRNKMLYEFYCNVDNLAKTFKPDIIACEYPSDMLGAETARLLIGYFTIVKLVAVQYDIAIQECYVTSVRKIVTGSGKSEKVTVCDSLVDKLNIDRERIEHKVYYSPNGKNAGKVKSFVYDESDALALCYYALNKDGVCTARSGVM